MIKHALYSVAGVNPEDVLLDRQGNILSGLEDGRIVSVSTKDGRCKTLLNTGGRPLGMDWLPDGRIVVCDALLGLLAIDLNNKAVDVLADRYNDQKFRFCNNPAVSADGTIYFSDSSTRYGYTSVYEDIVENRPNGRVFCLNLDGDLNLLADDLYFANGVALAEDEAFLLVAETGRRRIIKLWLTGPEVGNRTVFADDLPGMPDNLSFGTDGLFWAALPSKKDNRLNFIHRIPFALRKVIASIPAPLRPKEIPFGAIMAFDNQGRCKHYYEMDPGVISVTTGIREYYGQIYAGTMNGNAVIAFQSS